MHPDYKTNAKNKDLCMIRVDEDLSEIVSEIPFLFKNFEIEKYLGAACWTAGWGSTSKEKGLKFFLINSNNSNI